MSLIFLLDVTVFLDSHSHCLVCSLYIHLFLPYLTCAAHMALKADCLADAIAALLRA